MIILSGILSSIIATVVYAIFAYGIKPKIVISDKVCVTSGGDDTLIYKIKVVNKTKHRIIDVKYNLDICNKHIDDVTYISQIPPIKSPLTTIAAFNEEDTDYAIRFAFKVNSNKHTLDNDDYLEFTIQAKHPFSGHTAYVSKKYCVDDLAYNCVFRIGLDVGVVQIPSNTVVTNQTPLNKAAST